MSAKRERTLLTKMSSPSSLSASAMSDSPGSGPSAAGKGGGFRSELAAIFPVVRTSGVPEVEGCEGRRGLTAAATPTGHFATLQPPKTALTRLTQDKHYFTNCIHMLASFSEGFQRKLHLLEIYRFWLRVSMFLKQISKKK